MNHHISFPQTKASMNEDIDSLFSKMGDKEDLGNKIFYILQNPEILLKMKEEVKKSGIRIILLF